jgi:hypothetical protein
MTVLGLMIIRTSRQRDQKRRSIVQNKRSAVFSIGGDVFA